MKRNLIYHTPVCPHSEQHVIAKANGEFETRLEAIAKDGLTLSADRKNLDSLLPNHGSCAPKQAVALDIEFELAGEHLISANCSVIAVRRLSKERYELKLTFHDLTDQHEQAIDRFVERALYGEPERFVA